jgi:hypothetical protein
MSNFYPNPYRTLAPKADEPKQKQPGPSKVGESSSSGGKESIPALYEPESVDINNNQHALRIKYNAALEAYKTADELCRDSELPALKTKLDNATAALKERVRLDEIEAAKKAGATRGKNFYK